MNLFDDVAAGNAGGLAGGAIMGVAMTMGKATGMVPEALPLTVQRSFEVRVGVADRTGPHAERGWPSASACSSALPLVADQVRR